MPKPHYDIIIVGAGVLGSFHAYHACKKGLKVLLVEKDPSPREATIRNFGMVIPSGMSRGKWQAYGRRSTEIYLDLQSKFDISVQQPGSVYIASDDAESILLQELNNINEEEHYPSHLLSQEACLQKLPGLKKSYCKAGLRFPQELTLDPSIMIHRLIAYMQEQLQLQYQPATHMLFCEELNGKCQLEDQLRRKYTSDKVIICNGRDFQWLFPNLFAASDIIVSKLQMMRTEPMPNYKLPGAVFTGLSIRRYESFAECPSYQQLKAGMIEDKFKKWGIHILFKQAGDGSMIIGDSHEYAPANNQEALGFDNKQEINNIIIAAGKEIFEFPHWNIASTWNGYYAQSPTEEIFTATPAKNIHIITAIGGKGMTASAGLAEENINKLF
jgi:FAD dependent oxidoreductase TIGR03364